MGKQWNARKLEENEMWNSNKEGNWMMRKESSEGGTEQNKWVVKGIDEAMCFEIFLAPAAYAFAINVWKQ